MTSVANHTEYEFPSYACFCIPFTVQRFLTVDFLTLLVLCYCYVELQDPQFDLPQQEMLSSQFVSSETRDNLKDLLAFILFICWPYVTAFAVFYTSTLV